MKPRQNAAIASSICADDIFRPAGLLVIGPWAIKSARPKPERRKPCRSGAKQLRLDFDTSVHSKKDPHQ